MCFLQWSYLIQLLSGVQRSEQLCMYPSASSSLPRVECPKRSAQTCPYIIKLGWSSNQTQTSKMWGWPRTAGLSGEVPPWQQSSKAVITLLVGEQWDKGSWKSQKTRRSYSSSHFSSTWDKQGCTRILVRQCVESRCLFCLSTEWPSQWVLRLWQVTAKDFLFSLYTYCSLLVW